MVKVEKNIDYVRYLIEDKRELEQREGKYAIEECRVKPAL
jgi:hypothetical protein